MTDNGECQMMDEDNCKCQTMGKDILWGWHTIGNDSQWDLTNNGEYQETGMVHYSKVWQMS